MEYSLEDLRSYPAADQFITLACISNRIAGDLIGTQRWTGVPMQALLPEWELDESATHLLMRSVDGFYEVIALDLIRNDDRVMLAYAWDGLPLRREHGFPLRIYIPDRYGMKQPKWLESIEAMDHWEAGYWVERGWSREAIMNATSVIDTVATDSLTERDGQTLVPIGGIAHAGVRGISRVEVQVDDGEWREARLRQPISDETWVIWRYDWPFQEGSHTFAVRCYDGDGTMQVLERTSVRPDGATGVHSVTRSLTGA
jgi:DMSO/TMAO reductase YedYZ molybdopterin-dependent catalytic subunit